MPKMKWGDFWKIGSDFINVFTTFWAINGVRILIADSQFPILYALSWPLNHWNWNWVDNLLYVCNVLIACWIGFINFNKPSRVESRTEFRCWQCYRHHSPSKPLSHVNIKEIHIVHRYGSWILIKSGACVSLCCSHLWARVWAWAWAFYAFPLMFYMHFHFTFSTFYTIDWAPYS